jgi:hypothetical protein
MTEHDPAVMNVEEWASYWHSAHADIVFVSVTGILAFYPSRMSPDLNWGDALEAHPDWAMRNKNGSVQYSGE